MSEDESRQIRILHPIPEDHEGAILLYHIGGGRAALQHFLGDPDRRRRLFSQHIHRDRVIGAMSEGKSLGFASFKLGGRGPYSPPFRNFRKEYGFFGGLFRFFVFSVAEWRDGSANFYLYGLNVTPEERRRGVATMLLDAVAAEAARAGCRTVELEVGSKNEKAINLYRANGYVAKGVVRLGPLRRLFPFPALVRMELALPQSGVPPGLSPGDGDAFALSDKPGEP